MDRRIQKTRESIFSAFSSLLAHKRYSKITVQDIIDEANIGRSTFYSHFETKDDLLKALCSDIFDHIFSEDLISESTHDFSYTSNDLKSKITHILYHLKDSKRDIKGILSCESRELFLSVIKTYLEQLFNGYITNDSLNEIPKEYVVNHMAGSFVETIKWWMHNDMAQSPEELSRYFFAVISPPLSHKSNISIHI
ncbi:transcriptional regulator, TetR family [Desulfofarcimen acetoxidans DSM 771]|uniref:Transcriptional regulator, TetR family n=1 Tax=Desulfofarcimen acetoxidans (strain ATCC 49208 / DSM 771 / KCTC 5769 / VKM B-1644 / 5575) TaxID=485916 RepID=C8W0T9_DESAS|nr:TetR/AcrR family transcriptional regulator [Desulfofarcimen acetoxidans]ACV63344.1 transcriptional regulator, TetR family [Desulfofarcimen acetoxidans DSM 771]